MKRAVAVLMGLCLGARLNAATFTVTNTNDSGAGSFRQAIIDADASPGFDTIAFDIPGTGVHTITPSSFLPALAGPLLIDGYTQPGASPNTDPTATNAILLIELDGSVAGDVGLQDFQIGGGGGIEIRGLVINRWDTGIRFWGDGGNAIRGCFIGTDPAGTSPRPNTTGMLIFDFGGTEVGGTSPADRNLVSGNLASPMGIGIQIQAGNATVRGNLIGTDSSGTKPIANTRGIQAEYGTGTGVVIGGPEAGAGNVISGNAGGIYATLSDKFLVIQGNRIGTTADGTGPLPNSNGIVYDFDARSSVVGGIAPGEGNVIACNYAHGISIVAPGSTGITIRGNSIHDNFLLGIELGNGPLGAPPVANDPLDADNGANGLQNYPLIQTVEHLGPTGAGSTRFVGQLRSLPSTAFDIDFYANPSCSNFPREFLEGETYVGSTSVNTDASGVALFDVTFLVETAGDARFSATATDPDGNTSEFSQRILYSVFPASGPSAGGTAFTALGSDFADPTTLAIDGVPATDVAFVGSTTLTAVAPAFPPGTSHDIVATTADGQSGTLVKGWVADFLDVDGSHPFYSYVTTLISNGITVGVGGGIYGVDDPTLRQQMAVFLLRSRHGLCYAPPPCTGLFADVPCPSQFADWIDALANEGITGGCGGGDYCPLSPVRRDQMAVFLLKAEHGSDYVPPPCTGVFADVACPSPFADWIEQLAFEKITSGCGGGNFCPDAPNTRGQMAVFLTKTMGLQ